LTIDGGAPFDLVVAPFEAADGPALGAVLFKELVEDEPLAEVV